MITHFSQTYSRQLLMATLVVVLFFVLFVSSVPLSHTTRAAAAIAFLLTYPTGLGLLFFPDRAVRWLGRTPILLISHLFGALLITLVFLQREFIAPEHVPWIATMALVATASALGFWRRRGLFTDLPRVAETAAHVLICTLLAFAVPLFLNYGLYSTYPNANLFQFVHPLKGAVEFARFDRLNPFTTDSYIPVLQVTWGLVLRLTNVSPADLFRVLPIYAFLLNSAVAWVVAGAFSARPGVRLWIVALLSIGLGAGANVLSNGDFAAVLALLLFAMLAIPIRERVAQDSGPALLGGLVLVAVLLEQLPPICYALTAGTVAVLAMRFCASRATIALGCCAIVCVCAAPFHRSSPVFLLASIAAAWSMFREAHVTRPLPSWMLMVTVVLPGIVLVEITATILVPGWENEFCASVSSYLFHALLGTNFGVDTKLGLGARVALFETSRNLVLVMGLALAAAGALFIVRRKATWFDPRALDIKAQLILRAWFVTMALLSVILIGVPFVYRLWFVPATLLAGAFGLLSAAIFSNGDEVERRVLWGVFAVPLAMALAFIAINHAAKEHIAVLLSEIEPLAIATTALLCASFLWVASRRRGLAPTLLTLLAVGVLLDEQTVSRAYFSRYHYGNATTVMHSGPADAVLARYASHLPSTTLVLSDPTTAANLGAQVGLDSVVGFSNLDTLASDQAELLRATLRDVITGSFTRQDLCGKIPGLISGPANYAYLAQSGRSGSTIMQKLGYRAAVRPFYVGQSRRTIDFVDLVDDERNRYRLAIVLTGRTIDWAGAGTINPYSATNTPLPYAVLTRLQHQGAVTSGSQAAILTLECASNGVGRSVVAGVP